MPFWTMQHENAFAAQCAAQNGLDYVLTIRGAGALRPVSAMSFKGQPALELGLEMRTAAGQWIATASGKGGPLPGEAVPSFHGVRDPALDTVWPEYARRAVRDILSKLAKNVVPGGS